MARMTVSSDELLRRHPTIESLEIRFKGVLRHQCGLISKGSEIKFGKLEDGWDMEVPMSDIYYYAEESLGDYDPSNTRVVAHLQVVGRAFDIKIVNDALIEVEREKRDESIVCGNLFDHFSTGKWTVQ